ncbi:Caffeoylshikimate esterase [Nymphaea thermarum]|nr:Caffeoylshikimate esterase [Nymphaea thermarum]
MADHPPSRNFWGDTPEQEHYASKGIQSSKSFYTSPRGLSLFTRSWQPLDSRPRGIVCMVHGYGNDISWTFQATPIFLAQMGFAPTLPIVPTADLMEKSVKVPEKKIIAGRNPMRYSGKPRLGTVVELLRVTDYLDSRLCEVSLPFIVLHGSADVVTDPKVSSDLYEAAKSEDKSIRTYDGMMHSLLFGETDENVNLVRNDIVSWLSQRLKASNNASSFIPLTTTHYRKKKKVIYYCQGLHKNVH